MDPHDANHPLNGLPVRSRIPTVEEALTFSPFTSIIPFDTATIPLPLALASATPLRLLSSSQVPAANEALANAERATDRLQRTIADVQRLLESSERPKFKFKTPASFVRPSNTHENGLGNGSLALPSEDPLRRLSPFARKVFDKTLPRAAPQVAARHTSLGSTVAGAQASVSSVSTSARPKLPAAPSFTPQPVNGGVVDPRQLFVANPVLSQDELSQYSSGALPPLAVQHQESANFPNGIHDEVNDTGAASHQRQKATTAIQNFNGLASDLSEAEIDFESGSEQSQYFMHAESADGGSITVLQPEYQFRLDKFTTSLMRFKAAKAVPVDDLARMQKIASATITAASNKYLGIGSGWDDQDLREWIDRLGLADQAFVAARTVLRIMNCGIEEKQLFSEDILATMLDFMKNTIDTCVIPTVEMRPSGDHDDAFKTAHRNKDKLVRVLGSFTKALNLLGDVIHSVDLDDTALTSIESMCIALIFVENAPSEATSSLGIQAFERVRRVAMDALAKLFDRNSSHRQSIFDDVLTSLERLPVSRQNSRQYTLPDAKPIQLVSALLLRLIQTSAIATHLGTQDIAKRNGTTAQESDAESDAEDDADFESDTDNPAGSNKRNKHAQRSRDADLESMSLPAYEQALGHARYVTNFLVSRALNSTKASGEPYRVLLDIFVDDFINVLGNTDWPAAEMMLRQLVTKLWDVTENNNKASVPSKAMALELMGSMLTGITDLRLKAAEMVERAQDESPLLDRLKECHALLDSDEVTDASALSLQGPYRAVLEYLRLRPESDSNIIMALGYHVTQWAYQVLRPPEKDTSGASDTLLPDLVSALENLIRDPVNFGIDGEVSTVSTVEGRLGALLVTMRLSFCRFFNQMFNKLLSSMNSDQASLRSKSLRSVEDVLTKDPSILDRGSFVLANIARCMTDTSPLVRDAALGLLATCLNLRQKLDVNAYEHILKRTSDNAINVRKRAIRLSKDIYLRNDAIVMRARVADALIHCVSDPEPTIVELGRQTLEEIWIAPFYEVSKSDGEDAQAKTKLAVQVSLIIETVKRNTGILLVLQDILEDMMSAKSKSAANNIAVCKAFVLLMVDAIVDVDSLPSKPPRSATMQALSIFVQARPKLFGAPQIQPLLPYLKSLQGGEDLDVYRYTIIILRSTLPHISNLPQNVLLETQTSLLANISKLPASELKEVASCLWTLSKMSKSTDKIVAVTRSAMENLKTRSTQLEDDKASKQAGRLLTLVGHLVAAFDLDANIQMFKDRFPNTKANQVVAIATEIVCPLTSPKTPPTIRATALEALLCMCHAWPNQYLRPDVGKSIELVLSRRDPVLELVLMTAWRNFFVPGSDRRPVDDKQANNAAPGVGAERIEKTYVATDRDGASTALAQRFMSQIIHISLNSTGELGFMAAQVMTSINKLGLVHPKESASALVALETSPNTEIARLAYEEHQALFSKHESIFEKETIRAVHQAFEYQRNTIKEIQGSVGNPPGPKLQLFWDVLKNASAKVRKRFLSNVCGLLDFKHGKLDMTGTVPKHVEFTAFCVQNLALFDYTKLDDLQTLVDGLEKVFASTGTAVAHGIEAINMDPSNQNPVYSTTFDFPSPVVDDTAAQEFFSLMPAPTEPVGLRPASPSSLRELTASAQILTLIYDLRTYLRRVYSLAKAGASSGARGRPPKDPSKTRETAPQRAPQRVPNAGPMTDKFLRKTAEVLAALGSEASQREMCVSFQTLMAVDDEVKVKPEEEEGGFVAMEGDAAGWTSADESGRSAVGTPGRKRKGTPLGGTPRKKNRSRSASRGRKEEEDEWF